MCIRDRPFSLADSTVVRNRSASTLRPWKQKGAQTWQASKSARAMGRCVGTCGTATRPARSGRRRSTLGCGPGGVGRAEVGAVSGEDLDPLVAGRLRCVGDEVGGVVVPAPGHRDIGRGCAGVFPNDQVCGVGGGSLGAIDGAGVGELDVVAHVRGGQDPFAAYVLSLIHISEPTR